MVFPFGREGHGGSGLKEFGVPHLDGSVGGVVDQVAVLIVPINLKERGTLNGGKSRNRTLMLIVSDNNKS